MIITEGRRVVKSCEMLLWELRGLSGTFVQRISQGERFPDVMSDLTLVGYVYTDEDAVAWLNENNFVFAIDSVD